jgi:hypothetical protein
VVAEEPTLAARWLGLSAALHNLTAQDRMRAELVVGEAQERLSASAFEAGWNAGSSRHAPAFPPRTNTRQPLTRQGQLLRRWVNPPAPAADAGSVAQIELTRRCRRRSDPDGARAPAIGQYRPRPTGRPPLRPPRCWKQSEQNTGLSLLGWNGTCASLPQLEQVAEYIWRVLPLRTPP